MSKRIFKEKSSLDQEILRRGQREGIEIDKGAVLTTPYLEAHEDLFRQYADFFTAYPDLFLDLIKPEGSSFTLFFYQRIVLRAIMRFKEVYVVACMRGDTPILTQKGMIPIKDFNPNDKVWADGHWAEVENLNIRDYHNPMYQISAENCFEDSIVVTDNHKFLTIPRANNAFRAGKFWDKGLSFFQISDEDFRKRKEFYRTNLRECEPQWVEAKDLKTSDWLLSKINLEIKPIEKIASPEPYPNQRQFMKKEILINEDFFEWLGIWLAEGGIRDSRIDFTININESHFRDRIIELTKKVFGLDCADPYIRTNNSQIIAIHSRQLVHFMHQLFGTHVNQWNKFIPSSLLYCEPKKQLQLVKGWLAGDGGYRKPKNSARYKGTTVSSALCEGIKFILYRNFINPSITTEVRKGKAKVYNININGHIAESFYKAIKQNLPIEVSLEDRIGEYYPTYWNGDFYMRNKVREVKNIGVTNEDVYCLQLAEEQFNVNGVEGHNCRAFSKSFLTIIAMFLQCIFIPGTKRFICAPAKNQSAQIAKEKIFEIYNNWPLLRREIVGGDITDTPGNFGKDYVTLKFRNGSQFDVVGALDSQRGGRRNGGLIDEIRDHDEVALNEIVLPLLNVSRRLPDNTVNDKEPNQQTVFCTSAGNKISFA